MADRQLDILFVHPGGAEKIYQELSNKFTSIETPTWCLLLAQSCRSKGFGVAILDCDAERLSYEEAVKRIRDFNPKLVCFTVYGQNPNAGTTKMYSGIKVAELLKQSYPEYNICFVGSHVSALPKEVLAYDFVDFVLLNEGVYALHNLLKTDLKNDLQNVKGIGWKNGSQILNDPERVVPNDRMDIDLPGSAWDLLPYKTKPFDLYRSCNWHANYIEENREPYAALYTSLGCQFKCSFCYKKGTKIIVGNGKNKKIEEITENDTLVAFDIEKFEVVETKIKRIASRKVCGYFRIKLSDGKLLQLTGEHPLYCEGKWVNAENIKVDDKLLVIDSKDKISLLMKNYNPMKNSDVVKKSSEKTKEKIRSGEYVPWMCTSERKKVISNIARDRASGPDNPMLFEHNQKKASERMRGDKNPGWQGGISKIYQEYPVEFSSKLKRKVRKRDGYFCQECNEYRKGKKLNIHHIDYNKHNNEMCNLISLCDVCHTKTNFNRNVWEQKYKEKMLLYENCPHYVSVKSIIYVNEETEVYNFECSPYDNYFANYILGHNCMINIVNRTDNSDGVHAANSNVMRFWSPEFIIKEIDKLAEYGVRTARLSDEMFLLNRKYYEPLVQLLAERDYKLNWWCYSRVDTVNKKHLESLKKAGINWVALGIETSDQKVRQEITKGSYKEVKIGEVIKDIESAGMYTIANYIFGLPDDDYANMNKTLDSAIELNTETANFYPCFALPGSPLYYDAKRAGWDLPKTFEEWSFHSYECLPLPTKYLSAAEVLRFRDRAWQMYFTRSEYHDKVEKLFGKAAVDNIKDMTTVKLKRKLLGD